MAETTTKKEYRTSHNMISGTRRPGDRKDGELLRNLDGMHFIVPLLYPNRCDNEAYISEKIDMAPIEAYVNRKNEEVDRKAKEEGNEQPFHYSVFHIIVAAILRTLELRPKMNRFIANKNMYQRNYLSASFVVKKEFADDGAEALAFLYADPDDTVDSLHEKLRAQIQGCRSDKVDASTDSMNLFNRMPRWLGKFIVWILTRLDIHGKVPKSLIATDPYYSSLVLTNLGSIRLKCGYHHLTNWGTNSVFCVIGETEETLVLKEDGTTEKKKTIELGLTIDERIADGYYYSKTIRLLKTLLANPELLEEPLEKNVDY